MTWEDIADMDQNPPRNCLSFSTGMEPSGGCFRAPVLKDRPNFGRKGRSGRLVIMPWEDMANQSSHPTQFRLSFNTGVLKHPSDGFTPVLRDGQFLDGF